MDDADLPDDTVSRFSRVDPVVVGQRQRVRPDEVEIVLVRDQAPAARTVPCHAKRRPLNTIASNRITRGARKTASKLCG